MRCDADWPGAEDRIGALAWTALPNRPAKDHVVWRFHRRSEMFGAALAGGFSPQAVGVHRSGAVRGGHLSGAV